MVGIALLVAALGLSDLVSAAVINQTDVIDSKELGRRSAGALQKRNKAGWLNTILQIIDKQAFDTDDMWEYDEREDMCEI